MKTKTASVRLPKEMFEEIDNICDSVGCSRNDWIKDTLQDKLREENSQDQEENSSGPHRNTTPKEESEPKRATGQVIKTSNDDGKTWEDVLELKEPKIVVTDFNPDDYEIKSEPKPTIKEIPQDNSNKPPVNFVSFNGQLLPFAKRYNI